MFENVDALGLEDFLSMPLWVQIVGVKIMYQNAKNIHERSKITLREVTKETFVDVCRLSPRDDQKQFVASNAMSIAEAHFEPDYAWFRAVYAEDIPVGFIMLGIDPKTLPFFGDS